MTADDFARVCLLKAKDDEISELKMILSTIRTRMQGCLERIAEHQRRRLSGQWALFSVDASGKYLCVGVYQDNEDIPDEVMEKVVLIKPLPDHTTLTEFDGF